MMEKYSWNFDEHAERWDESADTIGECIAQAKRAAEDDGEEHDTVYIGKIIAFVPRVDEESVLDALCEQAGDFAGEVGDEWEPYDNMTMRPALEELAAELTAVVLVWLKKHGREPVFWIVEGVKEYPLTQPAEED